MWLQWGCSASAGNVEKQIKKACITKVQLIHNNLNVFIYIFVKYEETEFNTFVIIVKTVQAREEEIIYADPTFCKRNAQKTVRKKNY